MNAMQADAALVHRPENLRWLAGYTGEGCLYISAKRHVILTDFRYLEQVRVQSPDWTLELVSAGVGICLIPDACVCRREDIRCVPVANWHQALYMCILYDKWLEPPIWAFVEQLVKVLRSAYLQK